MRTNIPVLGLLLVALFPVAAAGQATSAADITSEDITNVLAIMGRSIDHQLKVVDIGVGNVAVGILHRTGDNDTDGGTRGMVHTQLSEVYYILSGGGTLLTGGVQTDATDPGPDRVVGPTYSAETSNGQSREVSAGDVIIIPAGVAHAWTSIPDQVTYLSIRPDPHSVLPAGYVHPELD